MKRQLCVCVDISELSTRWVVAASRTTWTVTLMMSATKSSMLFSVGSAASLFRDNTKSLSGVIEPM